MTGANEIQPEEVGDVTGTVEVRVYRGGQLIERILCESADAAAAVVERWGEEDDIECLVEDLATTHGVDDILAPELDETSNAEEDYPEQLG